MHPEVGQTLGGVVLRSKIADGGMATVWAAEHMALNREVAVKFLHEHSLVDPLAVKRFALEARTIARVSSPHVPQVFDHGVAADGTPYIVMELVMGVDLRSWVVQWGCLDLAQAVRLVDHISLALSAAHELGIVHRDVKPENMILSSDSDDFCAKLIDFGIAKSTGLSLSAASLTMPGTLIGTPCYMSPEQLENPGCVDERSDVWSLGVVTYWALTGKLPFKAETFADAVAALAQPHFTPPSELRAELPAALDVWFSKVLEVDRSTRVPTVDLMNRMLKVAVATQEAWTCSVPIAASPAFGGGDVAQSLAELSPITKPGPPRRMGRRRVSTMSTMGAAVVGALLLAKFGLASPKISRSLGMRRVATAALAPLPGAVASSVAARASTPPPVLVASPPQDEPPRSAPAVTHDPPEPPKRVAIIVRRSPHPTAHAIAPGSVVSPASQGPHVSDPGVATADPSDWHPRDDLGEP